VSVWLRKGVRRNTAQFAQAPFAAFEPDLELAFFVDAVLALDALLVAVPPVTAFLALVVPRLVLGLAFFSEGVFLLAYVFLGAGSVFLAGGGLTAAFAGLAAVVGFFAVLAEGALAG